MSGANVFIDRSQFPEAVRHDLIDSLRARAINHKFHYESHKQAAKWLALHEAYSPARRDPSCLRIYDDAFIAAAASLKMPHVHLVGLGCGGGQKEARLLEVLRAQNYELTYTASDVSVPLVLTAREAALPFVDHARCRAMVCDLVTIENLDRAVGNPAPGSVRLVTVFGLVPNFEPDALFNQLASLLQADDLLLLSANLAPGRDFVAGVRAVLPQYDNKLTRDWLLTFLYDLGVEQRSGLLTFHLDMPADEPARIIASYASGKPWGINVEDEEFSFAPGEALRLFFSYRYSRRLLCERLKKHGFDVVADWQNDSGEEGVFLCRKGLTSAQEWALRP
jgi:uncharacterized SAM-dependent methyltransferase